jgi:hypothetical protein
VPRAGLDRNVYVISAFQLPGAILRKGCPFVSPISNGCRLTRMLNGGLCLMAVS